MKSEGLSRLTSFLKSNREILWVGSVRETPAATLKPLLHRIQFVAYEALGKTLQKSQFMVGVISLCDTGHLDSATLFRDLEIWPRHMPVVLVVPGEIDEVDGELVRNLVNRTRVLDILKLPQEEERLPQALLEALAGQISQQEVEAVRRRAREGADDGEPVNVDLESLLRERTEHLHASKSKIERQVAKMRSIVKFVKELSTVASLEDFMRLLRHEVRPFHHVKEPILAFVNSQKEPRLVFYQGTQIYEKTASTLWPLAPGVRVNDLKDSKYLANLFGRPFARLLTVPLELQRIVGQENIRAPAAIYFEHALDKNELSQFVDFIEERLKPLSIALDRLLLENDLLEASSLWERTFDGIQDPVVIFGMDAEIIRANKAFHDQLDGVPANELMGAKLKHQDRYYEVHSYPILSGHDDRPTNLIQHYIDMTTAHRLQQQMVQGEKMAALGNLAGHIAHELNNPLTGIRSLAQILLSQIDRSGNVYNDLSEVERAAERCQKIIRNLIEFSSGGVEKSQVVVSMNDIVQKTLPFLKTAMGRFSTNVHLTEAECPVFVEPQLMQQVIFNIVKNACQAMGEKGELTIETETVRENGKKLVQIRIVDTGAGIPEEIRGQIFDFFFTTKSQGQGTGLGLSMSKSIVDRFGGQIRVESEPGKGSTFTVVLPFAEGT